MNVVGSALPDGLTWQPVMGQRCGLYGECVICQWFDRAVAPTTVAEHSPNLGGTDAILHAMLRLTLIESLKQADTKSSEGGANLQGKDAGSILFRAIIASIRHGIDDGTEDMNNTTEIQKISSHHACDLRKGQRHGGESETKIHTGVQESLRPTHCLQRVDAEFTSQAQ
jgi:hypothetical protein